MDYTRYTASVLLSPDEISLLAGLSSMPSAWTIEDRLAALIRDGIYEAQRRQNAAEQAHAAHAAYQASLNKPLPPYQPVPVPAWLQELSDAGQPDPYGELEGVE